jgi:hypothetical protein
MANAFALYILYTSNQEIELVIYRAGRILGWWPLYDGWRLSEVSQIASFSEPRKPAKGARDWRRASKSEDLRYIINDLFKNWGRLKFFVRIL